MKMFCYGVLSAYLVPGLIYILYIFGQELTRLWKHRDYYSHPNNIRGLRSIGRYILAVFQWISPKYWRDEND